jgi:Tol biopolymer transport system component
MTRLPLVASAAALAAVLFVAPSIALAQLPRDPAERARVIAQILETQARQLTVFDRQGRTVGVVGPRDLYNQPVFSPDATRMAVIRPDLEKESNDLWIIDVASARRTQLTSSETREGVNSPAWSPDGRQVAYVALRKGFFGIYRRNADGTGAEELIHQGSFPVTLTDWSHDGRYLSYFAADLAGAGLYALPIAGDRQPVEVLRNKNQNTGPRLSPDNRFMAFASNASGRSEIYAVPFDATAAPGGAPAPIQISDQGGAGMTFWRKDGQELFYMAADRSVMSVDVGTGPAPFGKPRVLFRPPADVLAGINPGTASVSRDGEKFVIAVPRPLLRQLTVYDRSGKAVTTVPNAGFYSQPGLSPDGTRAVVMRNDPRSGNTDIWVVELATGKGIPITNDTYPENAPIWSPDGRQVAYVSTREGISGIYR